MTRGHANLRRLARHAEEPDLVKPEADDAEGEGDPHDDGHAGTEHERHHELRTPHSSIRNAGHCRWLRCQVRGKASPYLVHVACIPAVELETVAQVKPVQLILSHHRLATTATPAAPFAPGNRTTE